MAFYTAVAAEPTPPLLPIPSPPSSERLVWLHPFSLSLAHSEEGLSSHCISFYHSPEPPRNRLSPPRPSCSPSFIPPFSSLLALPPFPPLLMPFLTPLLSPLSYQHPASKNKDGGVFFVFFSFLFLEVGSRDSCIYSMCIDTRQHLSQL